MSAFKLSRTLTILVIAGLAARGDCASVNSSSSTGGSKTEISNNNDDFDETPNFLNNIYEAATAASARRHKSPESESRVVAIDVNGTFGGTEQARMAVDEAVAPVRSASRGESTGCGRFKKCNRGEAGDTRLNEVKKLILEKLNMERPPNITKPTLPLNSPPVQQLMKKYDINITDDDVDDYDDNDFGTIKRKDVISVAKTRKSNCFLRHNLVWDLVLFYTGELLCTFGRIWCECSNVVKRKRIVEVTSRVPALNTSSATCLRLIAGRKLTNELSRRRPQWYTKNGLQFPCAWKPCSF